MILGFLLVLAFATSAHCLPATKPNSNQIRQWILDSISEMPVQGGYELTLLPAKKMRDAFTWIDPTELVVDPSIAVPSYCTTATYLVFYKTLEKYWNSAQLSPDKNILKMLKPNLEDDGVRIWGRWNSNGPGTGKLFFDLKLGPNFDEITEAQTGDFIKIFWNDQVGKLEKGHTGIFLAHEIINGVSWLRFWGSSKSTQGYSEKLVPFTDFKKILISRLENISNLSKINSLEVLDPFLASMLKVVSNWNEVRQVTGINEFSLKPELINTKDKLGVN